LTGACGDGLQSAGNCLRQFREIAVANIGVQHYEADAVGVLGWGFTLLGIFTGTKQPLYLKNQQVSSISEQAYVSALQPIGLALAQSL